MGYMESLDGKKIVIDGVEYELKLTSQTTATQVSTKVITGIQQITKKATQKGSFRYKVVAKQGDFYTFDLKFATLAKTAQENGLEVEIEYTAGKFGNTIVSIDLVEPKQ